MPKRRFHLLLTAEHAANTIPARYRDVAQRAGTCLETHRGYDPGTAELARELARSLKAPLVLGRHSRLLIELNRSPDHPRLWSEFSRPLDAARKQEVLDGYYRAYRDSVVAQIRKLSGSGDRVLHLSVHSFTPELGGEIRNADIGLLYDPRRKVEAGFCERWKSVLKEQPMTLRVRRNYPYLGIADGLVTHLRRQFSQEIYAGLELEVNQSFPLGPATRWRLLQECLVRSLTRTLARF
jgi:predicted N-formylglutamate amidohydrolase